MQQNTDGPPYSCYHTHFMQGHWKSASSLHMLSKLLAERSGNKQKGRKKRVKIFRLQKGEK